MRRTKASFELALRYCKQHEDQLRADAFATSMQSRDSKAFWRNVYKISNNKATTYTTAVGDAVAVNEIVNLWKDQFKELYNSVDYVDDKQLFNSRISNASEYSTTVVTI